MKIDPTTLLTFACKPWKGTQSSIDLASIAAASFCDDCGVILLPRFPGDPAAYCENCSATIAAEIKADQDANSERVSHADIPF